MLVGAATVTALPALHGVHVSDAYTFGTEHHGGRHPYLGYVVELGGLRVFHAGDSLDYPGLSDRLRELDVHVALLPINGRDEAREAQDLVGNMNGEEAADLAARAGIPVVVPMHYDMFASNLGDPAAFVAVVREHHPELSVLVPAHGRDLVLPAPLTS